MRSEFRGLQRHVFTRTISGRDESIFLTWKEFCEIFRQNFPLFIKSQTVISLRNYFEEVRRITSIVPLIGNPVSGMQTYSKLNIKNKFSLSKSKALRMEFVKIEEIVFRITLTLWVRNSLSRISSYFKLTNGSASPTCIKGDRRFILDIISWKQARTWNDQTLMQIRCESFVYSMIKIAYTHHFDIINFRSTI